MRNKGIIIGVVLAVLGVGITTPAWAGFMFQGADYLAQARESGVLLSMNLPPDRLTIPSAQAEAGPSVYAQDADDLGGAAVDRDPWEKASGAP